MSSIKKKLDRFLKNPKSSKYADIARILNYFGFEKIEAKGSHVKFKHISLPNDLIIPIHNNECKDFYKMEARKIVKALNKINHE